MTDANRENKDGPGSDALFKEPSSPKTLSKKEKTKYQTFKSDEDDSSENEDNEQANRLRRKNKKERSNTFKVKIKNIKGKKKEKDKDKDREKEKDKEKDNKTREKKRMKKLNEETPKDQTIYPLHGPVFGVVLEVAVERSGMPDKIELPRVVRESILFIEERGLDAEGIYRVSGVKSKVDNLKTLYNEGRPVSLEDSDPNTIASLLKLYLRELPSSILTTRLAPIFDNCINLDDEEEQVNRFKQLLNDLPCPNRTLLQWMFTHFDHVMKQGAENKMNIQNLSIVFSPTMSISHGVLNIFFQHTDEFFPDVKLLKYVPPPQDNDGLPNTLEGLQQLLQENEFVLSELHDKVNQGDGSQDEELWERQRQATQIKRKIKALKKLEKEKLEAETEVAECQEQEKTTSVVVATENTTSKNVAPTLLNVAAEKPVPATRTSKQPQQQQHTAWKAEIVADTSTAASSDATPVDEQGSNKETLPKSKTDSVNKGVDSSTHTKTTKVAVLKSSKTKKKAPDPPKQKVPSSAAPASVTTASSVATEDAAKVKDGSLAVEHDDEYKEMLEEEQRLLIENEELLSVTEMIKRKIQMEQRGIEDLKSKCQECVDNKEKENSSSESSSFTSSSSSLSQQDDDDDGTVSDEEDEMILKFEMIFALEKENKRLESDGNELLQKISDERKLCSKLRTDIRLKEKMLASTSQGDVSKVVKR